MGRHYTCSRLRAERNTDFFWAIKKPGEPGFFIKNNSLRVA
jgi:hypothetical protein